MNRVPIPAIAALALAGCAPGPGGDAPGLRVLADSQCFYPGEIHAFQIDDGAAYIRSNRGDVYRIDAPRACFDAGVSGFTVESRERVGQRICVGDQARVRVSRSSATPLTCDARVSGPITDGRIFPARPRS